MSSDVGSSVLELNEVGNRLKGLLSFYYIFEVAFINNSEKLSRECPWSKSRWKRSLVMLMKSVGLEFWL